MNTIRLADFSGPRRRAVSSSGQTGEVYMAGAGPCFYCAEYTVMAKVPVGLEDILGAPQPDLQIRLLSAEQTAEIDDLSQRIATRSGGEGAENGNRIRAMQAQIAAIYAA